MSGRTAGPGASARAGRPGRGSSASHEEEHENAERWLLSYADMITLLMALFIVLFAISQVDQKKLLQLSSGLEEYFGSPVAVTAGSGILDGSSKPAPDGDPSSTDTTARSNPVLPPRLAAVASPEDVPLPDNESTGGKPRQGDKDLIAIRDRIRAALRAKGLEDAVQFQLREHGLVVNVVTDRVLFDPGEAVLRPEGRTVLDAIAPTVRTLPNNLTVEGHTDDVPISGRFASNWELSTERSTTVLRHLLTRGVASARVSAAGYADQRPLATNATPAGRARNRRVAIVVLALPDAPPAASTTALQGEPR